jgi:xanthine dehydrogenase accessory factor
LERAYAPIGLDLGGRTPEETALSIIAEVVAVKNGRSGASLRETKGPIGRG